MENIDNKYEKSELEQVKREIIKKITNESYNYKQNIKNLTKEIEKFSNSHLPNYEDIEKYTEKYKECMILFSKFSEKINNDIDESFEKLIEKIKSIVEVLESLEILNSLEVKQQIDNEENFSKDINFKELKKELDKSRKFNYLIILFFLFFLGILILEKFK